MVSPRKLFPHLFPQNVPARANTSGERTIIPEIRIKVCFASKPRFFFLENRPLGHLMTSNMYYFIMTASGMEIGHRFRQHSLSSGLFTGLQAFRNAIGGICRFRILITAGKACKTAGYLFGVFTLPLSTAYLLSLKIKSSRWLAT